MSVIGFDTSNYTTSIAYFDGIDGVNCSRLLPVKAGELGLRQSDAVFHEHTGCIRAFLAIHQSSRMDETPDRPLQAMEAAHSNLEILF